jgi:hypothetical protein
VSQVLVVGGLQEQGAQEESGWVLFNFVVVFDC